MPEALAADPTSPAEYMPVRQRRDAQRAAGAASRFPLMLRALRLPRGGRVLEIGCGRGVALPVLATASSPSS